MKKEGKCTCKCGCEKGKKCTCDENCKCGCHKKEKCNCKKNK